MKIANNIAVIAAIFLLTLPALVQAQQDGKASYTGMIAAYNKGDHSQAFKVGFAYYHGISGAPLDFKKAMEWFRRGSEKNDMYACEMVADMYRYGQGARVNNSEALSFYRKAAGLGNTSAAEKLGDMYYNGTGSKPNRLEAAKWYQKAAEVTKEFAVPAKLGRMFLAGDGIKKNYESAMRWLLRADELGDISAAVDIATMYTYGRGVKLSDSKAIEWLLKGANAGDPIAMFRLAEAYISGKGIHKSYVEAYKWLAVVSAKDYNPSAEKLLRRVSGRMSRGELSAAKSAADKMIKKYVTPKDRERREYRRTHRGS